MVLEDRCHHCRKIWVIENSNKEQQDIYNYKSSRNPCFECVNVECPDNLCHHNIWNAGSPNMEG